VHVKLDESGISNTVIAASELARNLLTNLYPLTELEILLPDSMDHSMSTSLCLSSLFSVLA
jgi:hypothetical protein